MAVRVKIPTQLRTLTGGRDHIETEGGPIRQILDTLERDHPGLHQRLLEESGELRRFINVYVDGEDVRFLQGLDTEASHGSEVAIIPAVAGGA